MRLALPLALIVLLVFMPSALAHAEPVSSDPASGARLDESPSHVFILFNERIDPSAARLVLLDEKGDDVGLEDVEVAGHGRSISATIPGQLPPGGYALRWEVLSTTDGHKTFGTIPFGVGANATIGAAQGAEDGGLRLDAVIGKGLMFVGLALMTGTFSFWYLILPRGKRKGHEEPIERLGTLAGWTHVAGALLFGYSQWQLSGMAFSDYFYGTTFGQGIGQRLFLGVAVLAGMTYAMKRDDVPRWLWSGTAFALFLLFLVYGRFSHTAGFVRPEWVGVLADTLHLLAISVWTGGLVAFLVFLHDLPQDTDDLSEHLRQVPLRFSNTAFASVIVAALTGLFMLWAVVGLDYTRWLDGVYGYGLAAKIALAIVMILMGTWNKVRYVMRYARKGGIHTIQMFRANIQREVFVAAAVFLLAAIITNASPPIYP